MCDKTVIFMNIWDEMNEDNSVLEKVIGNKVNKRSKKVATQLISWLGTEAGQNFIEKVNELEYTELRADRQL